MRSLAAFSLVLLCACSGAASTEFFDSADGTSSNDVTSKPNGTLPSAPAPTGASTPDKTTTPVQTTDPTTPTPDPAQPPVENPPPQPTCTAETEANNNREDANTFTTCFSGVLSTRQDRDWGTFTVPANAKKITWTVDGDDNDVDVQVSTSGMIGFPVFNGGNVTPGAQLYVQVSATSGGKPQYEVHFSFP